MAVAFAIPILAFLLECIVGPESGIDSGFFRYVGWNLSNGGRMYETIWDNKGPVLFLPQCLGYLLFPCGTFGPGAVLLVMWLAILWCARKVFSRLTNDDSVAVWATFFTALICSGMFGLSHQNNQEMISLFFAFVGVLAALACGDCYGSFGLGVCVALVFLVKPNLVSFGGAFVVVWVYDAIISRQLGILMRKCLFSLAGFSLSLLLVTTYFAISGRAYALWDATFLFGFFEYGNRDVSWLDFWSRWITQRFANPFGGNCDCWQLPMFLLMFATGILGGVGLWRAYRRREALFLLVWMTMEYVMALSFRQFFEHYLLMTCPTAVVLTTWFALWRSKQSRCGRYVVHSIAVATVFLFAVYSTGMVYAVHRNNSKDDWLNKTREWAAENVQGGPVVVLGAIRGAWLMDQLKLKSPQKYCGVLMNYTLAKADWRKKEMAADLLRALQSQDARWLFSEKPLDEVSDIFAGSGEVGVELDRWHPVFEVPFGCFYRR